MSVRGGVPRTICSQIQKCLNLNRWWGLTFLKYQPSGAGGTPSPPATPHRLQRRTTCKIQNGCQGAPKKPTGSGKSSTPRFLGNSLYEKRSRGRKNFNEVLEFELLYFVYFFPSIFLKTLPTIVILTYLDISF